MRKFIRLLALAIMFTPTVTLAGGAADSIESAMDRMAERLDLTDEQRTKIETIIKEQRQIQLEAREEAGRRIEAVLTDEQKAKLEEIQKQHQEEMARRLRELKEQRSGEGSDSSSSP